MTENIKHGNLMGKMKKYKYPLIVLVACTLLIGAVAADLAFNNNANVTWNATNEAQATFTVNGHAYANSATVNVPLGYVYVGSSKDVTFTVVNTAGQQISFTANIVSSSGVTTSSLVASTSDGGVTVDTQSGQVVAMTFEDSGTTGIVTLHLVGFTLGAGNLQLSLDASIS